MSNDTHQSDNHSNGGDRAKSQTSFKSSFWLIIIIVGVFIAALNFVNVMKNEGEEGAGKEKKEVSATENKAGKTETTTTETAPATADTTHKASH